jgi:hypothetical protein
MDAKYQNEYYNEDPGDIENYLIGAKYLTLKTIENTLTGYTIVSTDKGRIGIGGFFKDKGFCFRTNIGILYFEKSKGKSKRNKQINIKLDDETILFFGSNKFRFLFHDVFITKDGKEFRFEAGSPSRKNINWIKMVDSNGEEIEPPLKTRPFYYFSIVNSNKEEVLSLVTYEVLKNKRQFLHKININQPLKVEKIILYGMMPSMINTLIL